MVERAGGGCSVDDDVDFEEGEGERGDLSGEHIVLSNELACRCDVVNEEIEKKRGWRNRAKITSK